MKLVGDRINLRTVQENDANFILNLRLDPILSRYISDTDANIEKQIHWIKQYKIRENRKQEYYFIIETREPQEKIGTIRLYNIHQNHFTFGSWIIKRGNAFDYAIDSYQMCMSYAFHNLNLDECYIQIRKRHKNAVNFHQKFGAMLYKECQFNYYFILKSNSFANNRKKMLALLGNGSTNTQYLVQKD